MFDLEHKPLYKEEAIVDGVIPWNNHFVAAVNFKKEDITIKHVSTKDLKLIKSEGLHSRSHNRKNRSMFNR